MAKTILIERGWHDNAYTEGVADYARKAHWMVIFADCRGRGGALYPDHVDGMIVLLHNATNVPEITRTIGRYRCPVVNNRHFRIDQSLPYAAVIPDDYGIGRMAADHFMAAGFRNFLHIGWPYGEDQGRREGYAETLKRRGFSSTYLGHDLRSETCRATIAAAFHAIEKPVAVFCENDDVAILVGEICRSHGLLIPEHVAILGVDNTELLCLHGQPPISSIDSGQHRFGFESARVLDLLMHGERPAPEVLRIAPVRVVARRSSEFIVADHDAVSAALLDIRTHCTEPITAELIVQRSGLGRSALYGAFAKHVGHTITQEIEQCRVQIAARLLRETRQSLEEIAPACGLDSAQRLSRLFKRQMQVTPGSYRENHHK